MPIDVPIAAAVEDSANLADRLSVDLDGRFDEVVAAYGDVVFTLVVRGGAGADAEDLAAEVFSRAYRALRSYPPPRRRELRLRPWLVTIALNTVRNHRRSVSRRPTLVPLDHVAEHPAAPETSPGTDGDPGELGELGELAVLLEQLPERQRLAVTLRHVVGLPFGEVAEALGCPVGTAKSHASRGIERLRTELAGRSPVQPQSASAKEQR